MSNALPEHLPRLFEVQNNTLTLPGGPTIPDLISKGGGRTPAYIYDLDGISRRVAELREALPVELQLHYAMKANPHPGIVRHLLPLVDGIDLASAGEAAVALEAGAEPEDLSFAGPGKRDEELIYAIRHGITLNTESLGELARTEALAREVGRGARVALRVNPDFELKNSGMKMVGRATAFGIDMTDLEAAFSALDSTHLEYRGLHVYTGSQNLSAAALIEAQQATFNLATRLVRQYGREAPTLNIGGGLGIPYFRKQVPLDLAELAAGLRPALHAFLDRHPQTRVVTELGRYLVGEAGIYVARVIDVKVSHGRWFAVTDGGLHHHLAASGNFGQVVRKDYPLVVANRVQDASHGAVNVVGPLCTPLDVLGAEHDLPRLARGDLVAVLQSGAYGLTASPIRFLSHPEPMEILWSGAHDY